MRKYVLTAFLLSAVTACSGTPDQEGIINTSGSPPAGSGTPSVNASPSQILTQFSNAGITVNCPSPGCTSTSMSGPLDALYLNLSSFEAAKQNISTINVAVAGPGVTLPSFDPVNKAASFSSTIAATDVVAFFTAYGQVTTITNAVGGIILDFSWMPFTVGSIGPVLNVLKVSTNAATLRSYSGAGKLTTITFEPSANNAYANGTWTVDPSQVVASFTNAFNVVKGSIP